MLGACRTYGDRSEDSAGRGQILPVLQVNNYSIDQKNDEIWTAQADLQPIHHKSDRLLGSKSVSKHVPLPLHLAADDPVGGLDHSLPIHPDQGSSKSMEYWEDQLSKKRSRKPVPKNNPQQPPQGDHQIDDYA